MSWRRNSLYTSTPGTTPMLKFIGKAELAGTGPCTCMVAGIGALANAGLARTATGVALEPEADPDSVEADALDVPTTPTIDCSFCLLALRTRQ